MKWLTNLFGKKAKPFKKSEWVEWDNFKRVGEFKEELDFKQNVRKTFLPDRRN